jgi:hypothetical protein
VNKDDMSDDAQFDAFLKGEGDLARRLQGMAQPEPSAALDAAILANARAAMAQEARPVAANDSGQAVPAPRRPASLGWRWRVPAGIAASVLVGVFAQRSFEAGGDLNDMSDSSVRQAEVAPAAPAMPAAAPVAAPPAAPELADASEEKAAGPSKVLAQGGRVAAPITAEKPQEPARVEAADARAAAAESALRERKVDLFGRAAAAQKSKETLARRRADDSELAYGNADRGMPAAPPPAIASAPAPAPAPAIASAPAAAPAPVMVAEQSKPAVFGGAQSQAEPQARAQANAYSNAAVIGGLVTDKLLVSRDAPAWLDRIEKLLADGRQAEAEAQWKAFRLAHPDYPVTDATRAKLEVRSRR